jgi:hypothetical protein
MIDRAPILLGEETPPASDAAQVACARDIPGPSSRWAMKVNPLCGLPVARRIAAAPPALKELWRDLMLELRSQAAEKGREAWGRHKYMMAAYWKVVGVYAGHAARLAR